ncbi:MAG: gluconokinase [Dehalococcoidia bacterium]
MGGRVIVVVMGVSGAGKTTVGRALAARLGWAFLDADDLHPAANVAKMAAGQPLTDTDRAPWLDAVAAHIAAWDAEGRSGVVACSALRRGYRDRLATACDGVRFVHLDVPPAIARERLAKRAGHFMPASLLDSQYATLEPIADDERRRAVSLDATPPPADVVERACAWIASA